MGVVSGCGNCVMVQVIKNTLNPFWLKFTVSTNTLCGSNPDRSIKVTHSLAPPTSISHDYQVTCYDWDSDGSHDLIGQFTTSLAELSSASGGGKKVSTAS